MNKTLLSGLWAMSLLFAVPVASQACTIFDGGCGTISGFDNKTISDNGSWPDKYKLGDHAFEWSSLPGQTLEAVTLNLTFGNVTSDSESWSVFVSSGGSTKSLWTGVTNGSRSISWDSSDTTGFFNQLMSSNSLTVWLKEGTWGTDALKLTSSVDVKCSTVPVPAAAPLFLGGMALVGWAGRRRRQGAASAA